MRCGHDLQPVAVRSVTEPVGFVEAVAFDDIPAPAFPGITGRGGDDGGLVSRIAAEILFGLNKIQRPDVKEVTEEDLVVGYVSQTAERMKAVCEEALGATFAPSP